MVSINKLLSAVSSGQTKFCQDEGRAKIEPSFRA
jgi:hypothetical protein